MDPARTDVGAARRADEPAAAHRSSDLARQASVIEKMLNWKRSEILASSPDAECWRQKNRADYAAGEGTGAFRPSRSAGFADAGLGEDFRQRAFDDAVEQLIDDARQISLTDK